MQNKSNGTTFCLQSYLMVLSATKTIYTLDQLLIKVSQKKQDF